MADKNTNLAITISTVDKATAKIRAINKELDAASRPGRELKGALSGLAEKSGLNGVLDGFKGVGAAIGDLLSKVAMIGGVVGLAGAAVFKLVADFDDLGDKAERFGVSVDFLAQMRYAAEKAGAPVEALDAGLQAFSVSLGKAKGNAGKMYGFMSTKTPVLLQQLKATKSVEEATDLLADAMAKLSDPTKRAALAAVSGFGPELAPLLAQGKGVKALRQEHFKHAGSMNAAAVAAGKVDDSIKDLHATTDGIKAAIVEGLSPALDVLVKQLSAWFDAHREDVRGWARDIGEKLPGAVNRVVDAVKGAVAWVASFVDKIGGVKTVGVALAAFLAGPLVGAFATLGSAALLAFGPIVAQIAAVTAGAIAAGKALDWVLKKTLTKNAAINGKTQEYEQHLEWDNYNSLLRGDVTKDDLHKQARAMATNDVETQDAMEKADAAREATGSSPAAGPTVEDQLDAAKAAIGFQNTNLAKNIAMELAAVLGKGGATKISLDITGAPRGARVKTDPKSTGDVDLSVGYQMGF